MREHTAAPDVVVGDAVVLRPAAARGQPCVAIDPDALSYLQPASADARMSGRHHPTRLHQLQRVYGEDALGRGLHLHRAGAGHPHRVADLIAVHLEADDRPGAQERASPGDVVAPALVAELLVRDVHVGPVHPHGHVAAHLVRPADERQPVAAVQVLVVLAVVERVLADHLHGIEPSRGYEGGRLSVGAWEMRVDHPAALLVGLVRPVGQRRLHRAPYLRLAQAVRAPGHDRLLQAPQDHVPHEVLPVLLPDVDDVVALTRDAGGPREVLRIREQAAPLRLEQVHDVQVLALGLAVRALGRQEVDVRVAAVPALRVQVAPALDAQRQLALSRLDADRLPQRLVLVTAGDVDDNLPARQPPLAGPVDAGVGNLAQAHVAADVHVPCAHVGVDLVVKAVGLVRHSLRRAEVDPARYGPAGVVVQDGDVDPVLSGVDQFKPHAGGLDTPRLGNLAPPRAAYLLAALLDGDRGRRHGGHLHVGRAGAGALLLSPALELVAEEAGGVLIRERVRVGSRAPVHLDAHVERPRGALRVLEDDLHRAARLPREGALVDVPQRDCGHHERMPLRYKLDRRDGPARVRVVP